MNAVVFTDCAERGRLDKQRADRRNYLLKGNPIFSMRPFRRLRNAPQNFNLKNFSPPTVIYQAANGFARRWSRRGGDSMA
jgi:hypothetical protein